MKNPASRFFIKVCVLALCSHASADPEQEYSAIDFSLRLPSALTKFSAAGDVAGIGGASAASPYASGINPASIPWTASLELPFIFSPEYSRIRFDRNPDLRVGTATASINTRDNGGFQATVSKIDSDESAALNSMQLNGDYAQIQWGKKIRDDIAIGGNINYSDFNTQATMDGFLVADGDSKTRGARAGILWNASQQLLAGLVLDVTSADARTSFLDIDCFCYIPVEEASNSALVRAGINYEYRTLSSIYMDYLVGRFRNSSQSMITRTLFLGIEHQVFVWLYARVGIAHDFRGGNGKTVGLGFVPSKNVSVDFAYQEEMFPELLPEFGQAEVLNVSVNFSF